MRSGILPANALMTRIRSGGKIGQLLLALVCVAAAGVTAFIRPTTRECGTVLYFVIHLLAALPALVIKLALQLHDASKILEGIAAIIYVATVGVIGSVWYVKGPEKWWAAVGMLGFTVFWIASYFVLLPTTSCF